MQRRSFHMRCFFILVASSCALAGWTSLVRHREVRFTSPSMQMQGREQTTAGVETIATVSVRPEVDPMEEYERRYLESRDRDARGNPLLARLLAKREEYLPQVGKASAVIRKMHAWTMEGADMQVKNARNGGMLAIEELAVLLAQARAWHGDPEEYALASPGLEVLRERFLQDLARHQITPVGDLVEGKTPAPAAMEELEAQLASRVEEITAAIGWPPEIFNAESVDLLTERETQRMIYTHGIQSMLSDETRLHQRRLAEERKKFAREAARARVGN